MDNMRHMVLLLLVAVLLGCEDEEAECETVENVEYCEHSNRRIDFQCLHESVTLYGYYDFHTGDCVRQSDQKSYNHYITLTIEEGPNPGKTTHCIEEEQQEEFEDILTEVLENICNNKEAGNGLEEHESEQ